MSLVVPLEEIFASETKLLAKHDSWERVELGKVCKILNGFPFKSTLFNSSEGFPVIRIRDIARSSTETFYNGDFPPEYVVKKGDLLIGMDGNFRCCEWLGRDAGLNQRVCKIIPDEKILHRQFLFYGLNGYLKAIEDVTSSVTVGHLSSRDVQRIPFPLPPLAEQHRIVAKLEVMLGKLEASQQRLEKIPKLLKRFRQSILAAACSGRLTADWRDQHTDEDVTSLVATLDSQRKEFWERRETARMKAAGKSLDDEKWKRRYKTPFAPSGDFQTDLPTTWSAVTVSQVAFLDVGFSFKSSEFSDRGIRLLRGENLEPGKLRWTDTQCWPTEKLQGLEYLLIEESEIILALDRPMISTGLKIARAVKSDLPCLLVQRMMRFKMVEPRMTDWLFYNLNLPAFIRHLSAGLTGSDIPHVTGTGVAEYTFGLPPLAEQQEIVRRVAGLFALADQLEQRLAQARRQVDKLTPSLLARAFAGKLVPQDPNDEPAEKLLERIHNLTARKVHL